jgi:hypothetical protein
MLIVWIIVIKAPRQYFAQAHCQYISYVNMNKPDAVDKATKPTKSKPLDKYGKISKGLLSVLAKGLQKSKHPLAPADKPPRATKKKKTITHEENQPVMDKFRLSINEMMR